MTDKKEMWEKIGHISASTYRKKALKSLAEETKIPSEIARDTGIKQNHISKTLKELREQELVVCINPEVRKGRLYRLTSAGEEIVEKLE